MTDKITCLKPIAYGLKQKNKQQSVIRFEPKADGSKPTAAKNLTQK
jgi:hypothetical protein